MQPFPRSGVIPRGRNLAPVTRRRVPMTSVVDPYTVQLSRQGISMHQAAIMQFERTVREFARWRAVPEDARSPAPGWWWGAALDALGTPQTMPPDWCARLELPLDASFDDGARLLLENLADQTALPWPGGFSDGVNHTEPPQMEI